MELSWQTNSAELVTQGVLKTGSPGRCVFGRRGSFLAAVIGKDVTQMALGWVGESATLQAREDSASCKNSARNSASDRKSPL